MSVSTLLAALASQGAYVVYALLVGIGLFVRIADGYEEPDPADGPSDDRVGGPLDGSRPTEVPADD